MKLISVAGAAAEIEHNSLEACRAVEHPHLIRVISVHLTNDFLVIAMDLADRTLMDRLQETLTSGQTGIPRDELLGYFRQAADAIDFLHSKGIQHRDLKPQNLLLKDNELLVADFGMARVLRHSVTGHTGNLTVAYAAPEYFDGQTTRQSDQYCLAVTYCQLRGGRLPFDGTAAQIVAGHLHRPPDLTMLPPEEQPIVARALSKKPSNRWPSCATLVDALTHPHAFGRPMLRPWLRLARWAALPVLAIVFFVLFLTRSDLPLDVRPFEDHADLKLIRSVSAGLVYAPFNRFIVITNGGGHPAVWDMESGALIRRLPVAGGACAALAPFCVPQALTGGDDASVILWDLSTGEEIRRFNGHSKSISSVDFSLDGRKVPQCQLRWHRSVVGPRNQS